MRTTLQFLAALLLLALPWQAHAQVEADALRNRIEAGATTGRVTAAGQTVRAQRALLDFYRRRAYEPVWTAERQNGLILALSRAAQHGLRAEDYRLGALQSGLPPLDLELVATDAFLLYGSHLLHGRVNPERLESEWTANRRTADMAAVLEEAIQRGDLAAGLEALAPPQERYRRLQQQLATLRAAEDSWTAIPSGETLRPGATGKRVAQVRGRLVFLGDHGDDSQSEEFDSLLTGSVQRFQARHGLEADGIIGPATLAALNRSPQERERQIEANMERFRWLPADLGQHHIEVNIPGFYVDVMRDGHLVRRHRAVVGRVVRETPMFSASMTYLVLAPYWHVPPTIAANDKFPAIKRNPGYVAAQKMTLFDAATNRAVDPSTVDWSAVSGREFNQRYRLRQEPGPSNALGDVKFMFPNRHNVYLHDTPSRELFSRAARNFSSGCVRVEGPLELAEYLLADQPEWTRARIDEVVKAGVERSVRLSQAIPVHLLYWTVWVDENGVLQYREDIYGRDAKVLAALGEAPPRR